MATQWTSEQMQEEAKLWDMLKKGPNPEKYSKIATEQVYSGDMLPFEEAKNRLQNVIAKQMQEAGSLEHIASSAPHTSASENSHYNQKPKKTYWELTKAAGIAAFSYLGLRML